MNQTDSVQKKSLLVLESGPEIDSEWENFISSHPDSTIYHHPLWLNALEREINQKVIRLICRNSDGKIEAVMPISFTKGMPLGFGGLVAKRRISSLPRTPLAGPLSINKFASKLLIEKAIQKVDDFKDIKFQIKSMDSNLAELSSSLTILPWRQTYVKILPDNPDNLRFGNSRNHNRIKWAVNKAEKSGLKIKKAESEAELKEWYKLYVDTMKWHVVPVRSFRFFKDLWRSMKPKGLIDLLLAEKTDDAKKKIIAGSLLLKFNKTVFYAFNGRDINELSLRPNDFIQWHAMHNSSKEGYSYYDMGEVASDNEGLDKFKGKWDCEVKQLYHYYYPLSKDFQNNEIDSTESQGFIKFLWRRLPSSIIIKLSDIVYKRL